MKKFSFLLITFVLSCTLAMADDAKKVAVAEFETLEHDFGKIKEEKGDAVAIFKLKNTGNAPLIIQRVQTTCGCTTPNYPKKPILPNEESEIKVVYSAQGRPGVFDKKITVFSNIPGKPVILTVKGEVIRDR